MRQSEAMQRQWVAGGVEGGNHALLAREARGQYTGGGYS